MPRLLGWTAGKFPVFQAAPPTVYIQQAVRVLLPLSSARANHGTSALAARGGTRPYAEASRQPQQGRSGRWEALPPM